MDNNSSALFLENQLCFPLYAASRLTIKRYLPLLDDLELTYPQYLVLLVLWQNDDLTVNEIGGKLFLESNTLTPLLKRLAEKGILTRQRSEKDERSVVISLSEYGKELKSKAMSIPENLMKSVQNNEISESEWRQLHTTLWKLVRTLSDEHAQGTCEI
jgi:MarR family transcriptional regulator, organic hydroperoxide resistance regulator